MTRNWRLEAAKWEDRGQERGGGYRYLPLTAVDHVGYSWEVARIWVDEEDQGMLDDARLIVAAPKLLAAAQLLVALEDNEVHDADTRWKTARKELRAAIAEAEKRE